MPVVLILFLAAPGPAHDRDVRAAEHPTFAACEAAGRAAVARQGGRGLWVCVTRAPIPATHDGTVR